MKFKNKLGQTFIKKVLIVLAIVVLIIVIAIFVYLKNTKDEIKRKQQQAEQSVDLKLFTENDIAQFNGEDLSKPIYIGLNGYVYDVTAGKKFYKTGGTYHYLAGKDSSAELNEIGGDIIQKKYPIIGKLED